MLSRFFAITASAVGHSKRNICVPIHIGVVLSHPFFRVLPLSSDQRYTKLGFAGNTEPQYIFPSGVYVYVCDAIKL